MSTHKNFDKICAVVLVLVLILTIVLMAFGGNADSSGTAMGYEDKLFDTSSVHKINIVMDDWDEFISNAESEEYYTCTLEIDGEIYKNVAIRGKDSMNSSDDTLLKYIDDDPDSYSNIFDNAKTDVSKSDKKRLIAALKTLSGDEPEQAVDVDAVIRYFVVHNFVLNFDSYTGSMIHNYYLYETGGKMQMIPWDYNLAFGAFQSAGGSTALVNYPIDDPVSGGSIDDRPMLSWIFQSEEYTELYHKYFAELISTVFDSGDFAQEFDSVVQMISPYVESDPTKFCTYEEFEAGAETLREFCLKRAESISGQLDGSIGSTSDTQEQSALVDAGSLQISDMGTMGNDAGGGAGGDAPQMPDNNGGTPPGKLPSGLSGGNGGGQGGAPNGTPGAPNGGNTAGTVSTSTLILSAASILVLIIGLVIAILYMRRK